jgi:hypothetical protein
MFDKTTAKIHAMIMLNLNLVVHLKLNFDNVTTKAMSCISMVETQSPGDHNGVHR